ncbi:hypothetical protein WMF20_39465 [Sorangium sp. So ce834]|uniref:hypothetical protein n=1 Tax=Sorangium sp. So ce834 TaxID=3133321 RepID=UPI003F631955
MPFYVAHSWLHAIITQESDRSDGQLADDLLWKAVPGLADTSDPDLVSFEAVKLDAMSIKYLFVEGAARMPGPRLDISTDG